MLTKDPKQVSEKSPWANCIGHLALVVNDIEKAKWFFGTVLQAPYSVFRETQIIVEVGESLLVAKLSGDAIDTPRQLGNLEKQVLDHYGFCAKTPDIVNSFYERIKWFSLEVVKEPYDRFDGRAFYFRDPFGNLVEYFYYQKSKV